jgi:hypothetical protein
MTATLRALLCSAIVASSAMALGAEGWSFLPDRHVLSSIGGAIDFPCRTEVSLSRELSGDDGYLSYLVGNDLAFVGFDLDSGGRLTLGGMGFIRAEFKLGSGGSDLQCGDYQVGLCSGYAGRTLDVELSFFHLSAHYGDDLVRDGRPMADDIGWEAFRLAASLPEGSSLRPYAALELKTGRRPSEEIDDRASLLGGLSLRAPIEALPIRLSAEARLSLPGRDMGFGIRIDCPLVRAAPGRPGGRAFGHELFVGWYRGPCREGVFYGEPENRVSAGFSLTI